MIVTIHRFQPKLNKYFNKKHELSAGDEALAGGASFFGVCVDVRLRPEPGFISLRTQRVDRIEVNAFEGTVDIYTSPIVTRKSPGSGRKFRPEQAEATDKLYSCFECEVGTCHNESHLKAKEKL